MILLVEDDPNFGLVLRDYLKMNGYQVDLAENGKIGYNLFKTHIYDICILDIMMPEMDGFSLAEEISKNNTSIPFIFLTAKILKDDIIKGYKLGAHDFLNKPFDPEILLFKIQAIINQTLSKQPKSYINLHFLDYELDHSLRTITKNGEILKKLSPKENQLLYLLLENKNALLPREQVLLKIWKENNYFTARSMDVYVNKLRKLFESESRITIDNIRGNGFCLAISS